MKPIALHAKPIALHVAVAAVAPQSPRIRHAFVRTPAGTVRAIVLLKRDSSTKPTFSIGNRT